MADFLDTYEEVSNFIEKIESLKDEIPEFSDSIWCEDALIDIQNTCETWLEDNREEYWRLRREEQNYADREFERDRL